MLFTQEHLGILVKLIHYLHTLIFIHICCCRRVDAGTVVMLLCVHGRESDQSKGWKIEQLRKLRTSRKYF